MDIKYGICIEGEGGGGLAQKKIQQGMLQFFTVGVKTQKPPKSCERHIISSTKKRNGEGGSNIPFGHAFGWVVKIWPQSRSPLSHSLSYIGQHGLRKQQKVRPRLAYLARITNEAAIFCHAAEFGRCSPLTSFGRF